MQLRLRLSRGMTGWVARAAEWGSEWLADRPNASRAAVGAAVAAACLGGGVLAWFSWDLLSSIPDRDRLRSVGDMAQATTLLDRRDRQVFTIFKEQRIEIPLERMSPHLVKAILAIEDQRFYEHQGVDTSGIL